MACLLLEGGFLGDRTTLVLVESLRGGERTVITLAVDRSSVSEQFELVLQ